MNRTRKNAPGAKDAQGLCKVECLDSVAQQDFTPEAIANAMHIAMSAMIAMQSMVIRGEFPASLVAANEASRAISAAVDSISAWVA